MVLSTPDAVVAAAAGVKRKALPATARKATSGSATTKKRAPARKKQRKALGELDPEVVNRIRSPEPPQSQSLDQPVPSISGTQRLVLTIEADTEDEVEIAETQATDDLNGPAEKSKKVLLLEEGNEVDVEEVYLQYDVSYCIRLGARKEFQHPFLPQSLEANHLFKSIVRPHLLPVVEDLKASSGDRELSFKSTAIKLINNDSKTKNLERWFTGCDEKKIDWFAINNALLSWGEIWRQGRAISVEFTFVMNATLKRQQQLPQKGEKRNKVSPTKGMLEELAARREALRDSGDEGDDEDVIERSTGDNIALKMKETYKVYRCPAKQFCKKNSAWCWVDVPHGGRHFSINNVVIKKLWVYYLKHPEVEISQATIPEEVKQLLYADQKPEKITNTPSSQDSQHTVFYQPWPSAAPSATTSPISLPPSLSIAPPVLIGKRDRLVRDYIAWQEEQYESSNSFVNLARAEEVLLEADIDLELIWREKEEMKELLMKAGVTRGVSTRIVNDIETFAEKIDKEREEELIERELREVGARAGDIITDTLRYQAIDWP